MLGSQVGSSADLKAISAEVDGVLQRFLATRRGELVTIDPTLARVADELAAVVSSGGKRLRPWLATWGYRAAGGEVDASILAAAAGLELLHTFALIQDDFMDRSDIRRGRTATHVSLGAELAILISDLALVWSDQLLCEAGFSGSRLSDGMRVLNQLRSEVILGQCLDLSATPDEQQALKVNFYKTASYTVLRPIQLGMTLAGAEPRLIAAVPAYAEAAGVAFQLRDDILGALGQAEVTGKPDGDDLINAKPTWLWARALRLGSVPPEGVEARREWIRSTGALAAAEELIIKLEREAREALRRLLVAPELRAELDAVTVSLVYRET
ncbi:MAG: polyprenyl synthetase family protein [Candidatus Dormibacteraceae bacterium]